MVKRIQVLMWGEHKRPILTLLSEEYSVTGECYLASLSLVVNLQNLDNNACLTRL